MSSAGLPFARATMLLQDFSQPGAGATVSLLRDVLRLREQFASDGNRRRLFAAFDERLAAGGPESAAAAEPAAAAPDGPIRLTRLVLRNWKVFAHAEFAFPAYDADRPVVLIGGKNGYGKTSFLEGLLYGLFGRSAVLELGRTDGSPSPSKSQAYRRTLERALHRPARDRGEGLASVRSEWTTPDGPLVVERRWYFDDEGRLEEADEVLTIQVGPDLDVLSAPEGSDPEAFFQAEIHRRLLSPTLAAFVFFDGEQVHRFAERGFTDQVRLAVEGVLGLSTWRDAAADLRDYARDRGRSSGRTEDQEEAWANETRRIELQLDQLRSARAVIEQRRRPLQAQRDLLLEQIGGPQSGTYAALHELLEARQANLLELGRARHELATAASAQLPSHLVGAALRSRLEGKLRDEGLGAAGREAFKDASALDALIEAMQADRPLEPSVADQLRRVWRKLGEHECTPSTPVRHAYLSQGLATRLLGVLQSPPPLEAFEAAAQHLAGAEAENRRLQTAIVAREQRDAAIEAHQQSLHAINGELGGLDGEARVLDQQSGALEAELAQLQAKLSDAAAGRADEAPAAERARMALTGAAGIEGMIDQVRPQCFGAVAEAVTRAYKALAHKDLVAQIAIKDDGAVLLLDSQGRDVRGFDASAGESQVFAMALMAAVGELAGGRLPVVIDTPLGRLDPDHRQRVLTFFTHQDRQTLLLSQPDEVGGAYLLQIEDRVAARFLLDHAATDAGPGGSVAKAGYFSEIAA